MQCGYCDHFNGDKCLKLNAPVEEEMVCIAPHVQPSIVQFEVAEAATKEVFCNVVLDGRGCGIPTCNCSPPNFISIGDGKRVFCVTLSQRQAEWLRRKGYIELRAEVTQR